MVFGRIAAAAIVAAAGVLAVSRAQATPYVTVDLSSYVDTSFGNLLGSTVAPLYPTGTTIGNTGVPFAIANAGAANNNGYGLNYWGGFLGVPDDHGVTLSITGLDIANVTKGYTLVNTTFGTLGDNPTIVTFKSSGGSSLTFDLIEGTEVRDYNNGIYVNTTSAPTTAEWFTKPASGTDTTSQRLDQQTYDLSSLIGNLTEVDVTETTVCDPPIPGNSCPPGGSFGGEDTIFSGLTFLTSSTTPVPEPGSLALLGAGLVSFGAMRRRRSRRT